jgi:chromatin remodeling complex protein RSC6
MSMPPKKTTKPVEVPTEVLSDTTAPVADVPVVSAVGAVGAAVEAPKVDVNAAYSESIAKLTAMRHQLSTVIAEVKLLQKRADREVKAVQKAGNKRKQRNATRAPSGFVKPTLISDQLAEFLSKEKGTLIARTDVTREINAYIRANKLQDPANGRKINPDAKLKKLLTLKPTDELTYFNLQRYMSQHFQKKAVV